MAWKKDFKSIDILGAKDFRGRNVTVLDVFDSWEKPRWWSNIHEYNHPLTVDRVQGLSMHLLEDPW
jgi:hypothetical protein